MLNGANKSFKQHEGIIFQNGKREEQYSGEGRVNSRLLFQGGGGSITPETAHCYDWACARPLGGREGIIINETQAQETGYRKLWKSGEILRTTYEGQGYEKKNHSAHLNLLLPPPSQ